MSEYQLQKQLSEILGLLKSNPVDEELLSAKSVSEKLDMSVNQVWKYVENGILPEPTKIIMGDNTRGATRWKKSDVNRLIASLDWSKSA